MDTPPTPACIKYPTTDMKTIDKIKTLLVELERKRWYHYFL